MVRNQQTLNYRGEGWSAKWTKQRGHGTGESREGEKPASVDMGVVVSKSLDKEIYERIKINKSNKFSISGENKSEEERTSKGQEGSEIRTNSWSSYGKTKTGEYVLRRAPK